jgi:hypothetical protein
LGAARLKSQPSKLSLIAALKALCHPKNYFRFGHFHRGSFLGVMDDLEVRLRIEIAGIVLRGSENKKGLCDEAEG